MDQSLEELFREVRAEREAEKAGNTPVKIAKINYEHASAEPIHKKEKFQAPTDLKVTSKPPTRATHSHTEPRDLRTPMQNGHILLAHSTTENMREDKEVPVARDPKDIS